MNDIELAEKCGICGSNLKLRESLRHPDNTLWLVKYCQCGFIPVQEIVELAPEKLRHSSMESPEYQQILKIYNAKILQRAQKTISHFEDNGTESYMCTRCGYERCGSTPMEYCPECFGEGKKK